MKNFFRRKKKQEFRLSPRRKNSKDKKSPLHTNTNIPPHSQTPTCDNYEEEDSSLSVPLVRNRNTAPTRKETRRKSKPQMIELLQCLAFVSVMKKKKRKKKRKKNKRRSHQTISATRTMQMSNCQSSSEMSKKGKKNIDSNFQLCADENIPPNRTSRVLTAGRSKDDTRINNMSANFGKIERIFHIETVYRNMNNSQNQGIRSMNNSSVNMDGNISNIFSPPSLRSLSLSILNNHTFSPNINNYQSSVFFMVIRPSKKIFEVVQVPFDTRTATLGELLNKIKTHCKAPLLRDQNHKGFCRPTDGIEVLNHNMRAVSMCNRRGVSCKLMLGELVVAIPQTHSGIECMQIAQSILQHPELSKMFHRTFMDFLHTKQRQKLISMSSQSKLKDCDLLQVIEEENMEDDGCANLDSCGDDESTVLEEHSLTDESFSSNHRIDDEYDDLLPAMEDNDEDDNIMIDLYNHDRHVDDGVYRLNQRIKYYTVQQNEASYEPIDPTMKYGYLI